MLCFLKLVREIAQTFLFRVSFFVIVFFYEKCLCDLRSSSRIMFCAAKI